MSTVSAATFISSIGVNTHLDRPTGSYANLSADKAALNYLGIKTIRDSFSSPTDVNLFETVAAATGVKFDAFLNTGQSYTAQINNMVTDINIIRFAEGVSEADDNTISTYNGLTGEAAAAAVQPVLYAAINAASSTVGVINYSLGNLSDFATAPNTSAYADYGNAHEYWGSGNPPGPDIPGLLSYPEEISGSDPIISTEAGYYTGPSIDEAPSPYEYGGVDQTTQAKYDLTVLFDNRNDGVPVTYLYELMDDVSDTYNTSFEDHYGLFNADGTPKLAATAIKNLISILENGDNGTKSGATFGYQLNGAPDTANSLLMEKSNGDFDIAVWNDIRLWSATSYAAVPAGAAIPVTLNFGQLVESVTEYDPLSGTSAVATWSNVSSISFDLPDHPVIFEVQPYPAGQLSLTNYDLPESLSSNQSTANLWSQLIANAIESNPNLDSSLTIKAVSTTGTTGTVSFNAATKSLVYTAPAYNGLDPADSFTYTISDSAGNTVTGTVAITELPNPNTTYATIAGAGYTAPANWTMVSLATGQSFGGSASGGDTFILDTDTTVWGYGSNNTIIGGNGSFYLVTGVNNAHVTLGNGNSSIYVSGSGAVITAGNGNNLVWQPTGYSTITMGNGNDNIGAVGLHNTVTVGSGTNNISLGTDGNAAGYESVTVGGGTNAINVGGTYDTIHVLGGSGNTVVSTGGYATVTIEGGSNTINLQGTNNTVILHAGTNTSNSGAYSSVQGGSGTDTIWIGGNYSTVTAGTGNENITFQSHYSTVNLAAGTDTFIENGGNNTIVLPPASGAAAQIIGNVVADGDKFDLTAALSATTWNGSMSTLSNYLSVGSAAYGAASTIFIDPDGTGSAAAHEIAYLKNSGGLTYAALVADSILPTTVAHTLGLTEASLPESVIGGQSSGNLWSAILANVIDPSWASSLTITGVNTTGTAGTVTLNAATQTLTYTAPAYNPADTTDSFTYSVSDGHGGTATGTVAVAELPTSSTTYATATNTSYTAPASGWTMISLATGQSLYGSSSGGDKFLLDTDTKVYAAGNGNTITGGNGSFYINAGVNNASVTIGNGNSTISVSGTGAVITTGNGNETILKPTGSATITTGNGNDLITALGSNNVISVGTGNSNLNIGTNVTGVGNESVTVAGGANAISVGGTGDTINLLGGTGNIVVSNAGSASVTADSGTNKLTIGGASNTVTLKAGINTLTTTSGSYDTIQGGSGTDSITASGNYNVITAGSGIESIFTSGSYDSINLTAGTDTFTEGGGSNTLVLPSTSGLTVQIKNNVIALNDTLDLRAAMAGTNWDGKSSDLSNYLGLSSTAAGAAVWVDADGTGSGASHNIAVLSNSGYLTYTQLLAHSIV